jgi:primosomal protein N' (replication factor Y)
LAGEVLVQTDFAEHPVYAALVAHDYDRFAAALLAERKSLGLPPFAHLALLSAEAKRSEALDTFLSIAARRGRAIAAAHGSECEVFSPVPAALPRRANLERAQVLAQSPNRRALQEFLPLWRDELERIEERSVRWSLDVDPIGFA